MPHSSPCWTFLVWLPHTDASRVTSRHQHSIFTDIRSMGMGSTDVIFIWNQYDSEYIRINLAIDAVRGHGLILTMW